MARQLGGRGERPDRLPPHACTAAHRAGACPAQAGGKATWLGHGGRLTFAVMTLLFVATAVLCGNCGVGPGAWVLPAVIAHGHTPLTGPAGTPVVAVLLSFPVATALATGTEASATAIAQLGQLGPDDRRRFNRGTSRADVHHRRRPHHQHRWSRGAPTRGYPQPQLDADRRRGQCRHRSWRHYALLQAASALLLAAASSSFQAGPGC